MGWGKYSFVFCLMVTVPVMGKACTHQNVQVPHVKIEVWNCGILCNLLAGIWKLQNQSPAGQPRMADGLHKLEHPSGTFCQLLSSVGTPEEPQNRAQTMDLSVQPSASYLREGTSSTSLPRGSRLEDEFFLKRTWHHTAVVARREKPCGQWDNSLPHLTTYITGNVC